MPSIFFESPPEFPHRAAPHRRNADTNPLLLLEHLAMLFQSDGVVPFELAPERSLVGEAIQDLRFVAGGGGLRSDLAAGSLQLHVARDGPKRDAQELGDLPPGDGAFDSVDHLQPEILRVGVHAPQRCTLAVTLQTALAHGEQDRVRASRRR